MKNLEIKFFKNIIIMLSYLLIKYSIFFNTSYYKYIYFIFNKYFNILK